MKPSDWFLVLIRRNLRPAATRVGVALYDVGRPTVDTDGNRIVHCQASLTRLCQLTHLTRKGVLAGLLELEDVAGLVRYPGLSKKDPTGYSLPETKPTGGNRIPLKPEGVSFGGLRSGGNSTPPIHGGGGDPSLDKESTTTPPPPGLLRGEESTPVDEALLEDLVRLGVSAPQEFLAQFPVDRVRAWVDWTRSKPQGIRNPGGFIRRQLQAGKDPPETPDPVRGADPRDFTRGKYGHLIKY